MKTLNFKELEVYINFAKTESKVIDIRESTADFIYQNYPRMRYKELAEKIFRSDGPFEIDEAEEELLRQIIQGDALVMSVTEAIENQLNNQ